MKKAVLIVAIAMVLLIGGLNRAIAQDQPAPKKDTVNMDTDAKPTFYYAVEDEKPATKGSRGSSTTILIIVGAVIVVSAAGFFLLKKKK